MAEGRISVSNHFEIQAILFKDAADFMQCSKKKWWAINCFCSFSKLSGYNLIVQAFWKKVKNAIYQETPFCHGTHIFVFVQSTERKIKACQYQWDQRSYKICKLTGEIPVEPIIIITHVLLIHILMVITNTISAWQKGVSRSNTIWQKGASQSCYNGYMAERRMSVCPDTPFCHINMQENRRCAPTLVFLFGKICNFFIQYFYRMCAW